MLHRLLQHRYSSTGQLMPENDIISEAMGHMWVIYLLTHWSISLKLFCPCRIAGSDTTSISLSYFLWELSYCPVITAKTQVELDQAMPNAHDIPDISVLQRLPTSMCLSKKVVNLLVCRSFCLTTVFLGLRIYFAAPSPLERVVPSASPKSGVKGFDPMCFELPSSTVIATHAWLIHRNLAIFPDRIFSLQNAG